MTEHSATEALRALAQGSENRSKIARLRDVLAEIENAQRSGVSNSKIVETLNGQGFGLTVKTFGTMLFRLRQERAKQTTTAPAAPSVKSRTEEQEQMGQAEDLSLTPKERRERRADQFIKTEAQSSNPLLKNLLKKEQDK